MPRRWLLILAPLLSLTLLAGQWVPAHSQPAARPCFKGPLGLAVDQSGRRAYVALKTGGAIAVVELEAGKVLREIGIGRQPDDLVMTPEMLFVTTEDSELLTPVDLDSLVVRRPIPRNAAPPEVVRGLQQHRVGPVHPDFLLGRGEWSNARAQASYRDHLFIVHQRPRNQLPATQVTQGWVFTNAIGAMLNTPALRAPLDEPQRGNADPSDIVVSADGSYLYIACAGADTVLVVDRERLLKKGRLPDIHRYDVDYHALSREDLTATRHYLVARLPTQANPRRLALSGDGKILVVSNHLADSLTVIDAVKQRVLRHIPLGGPEPDAVRRGAILFHSGRMTFQGQFSCASCHPAGGSDGLTWDLERDGVGNFKRTKSLLGVRETAPYGWHGSSPTLADRIAGTLRTLHRHEPAAREVEDLTAFLESLEPPTPTIVPVDLKPAVARGRELFQGKALCSNCHHRGGLDDGKSHDVGTGGPNDTQSRFDTPALRGVSRAAAFLHDGRAATLEEVFTRHNPRQRHGAAHLLSNEELSDLLAYLKSL